MTSHNAPPVVYPLGRCAVQGWLLSCLWVAGLLLASGWLNASRPQSWVIVLLCFSILVAGLAAFAAWNKPALGQLAWDGQLWRWESTGYQTGLAEQQLVVIADFQHLMLLRIENPARAALWLWAERKAFPSRWMDFRRAVYSPQRASTNAYWQPYIPAEPAPHRAAIDVGQSADVLAEKP